MLVFSIIHFSVSSSLEPPLEFTEHLCNYTKTIKTKPKSQFLFIDIHQVFGEYFLNIVIMIVIVTYLNLVG